MARIGRGAQLITADESTLTLSPAKVLSEKAGGTGFNQMVAGTCRIQRGTYTGTGAAGNAVAVGFRPQFIIIQSASSIARGALVMDSPDDTETGAVGLNAAVLATNAVCDITATGFTPAGAALNVNAVVYEWVAFGGAV